MRMSKEKMRGVAFDIIRAMNYNILKAKNKKAKSAEDEIIIENEIQKRLLTCRFFIMLGLITSEEAEKTIKEKTGRKVIENISTSSSWLCATAKVNGTVFDVQ